MPYCDNCESFVSANFHRVFADGDNTLHGCLNCTTYTERRDGITPAHAR